MNLWLAGSLFSLVGIMIIVVGVYLLDLTVPYNMVGEIEEGNLAMGWVLGGFVVSMGLVVHAALRQLALLDMVVYALFGLALNIVGYHLVDWVTPRWNLSKAIHSGNQGAAVAAAGVFLAIGLIVSGALVTP